MAPNFLSNNPLEVIQQGLGVFNDGFSTNANNYSNSKTIGFREYVVVNISQPYGVTSKTTQQIDRQGVPLITKRGHDVYSSNASTVWPLGKVNASSYTGGPTHWTFAGSFDKRSIDVETGSYMLVSTQDNQYVLMGDKIDQSAPAAFLDTDTTKAIYPVKIGLDELQMAAAPSSKIKMTAMNFSDEIFSSGNANFIMGGIGNNVNINIGDILQQGIPDKNDASLINGATFNFDIMRSSTKGHPPIVNSYSFKYSAIQTAAYNNTSNGGVGDIPNGTSCEIVISLNGQDIPITTKILLTDTNLEKLKKIAYSINQNSSQQIKATVATIDSVNNTSALLIAPTSPTASMQIVSANVIFPNLANNVDITASMFNGFTVISEPDGSNQYNFSSISDLQKLFQIYVNLSSTTTTNPPSVIVSQPNVIFKLSSSSKGGLGKAFNFIELQTYNPYVNSMAGGGTLPDVIQDFDLYDNSGLPHKMYIAGKKLTNGNYAIEVYPVNASEMQWPNNIIPKNPVLMSAKLVFNPQTNSLAGNGIISATTLPSQFFINGISRNMVNSDVITIAIQDNEGNNVMTRQITGVTGGIDSLYNVISNDKYLNFFLKTKQKSSDSIEMTSLIDGTISVDVTTGIGLTLTSSSKSNMTQIPLWTNGASMDIKWISAGDEQDSNITWTIPETIFNDASAKNVIALNVDGYAPGFLNNTYIDGNMILYGSYSNGLNRALYKIPIAVVNSQDVLEMGSGGDGIYEVSVNVRNSSNTKDSSLMLHSPSFFNMTITPGCVSLPDISVQSVMKSALEIQNIYNVLVNIMGKFVEMLKHIWNV